MLFAPGTLPEENSNANRKTGPEQLPASAVVAADNPRPQQRRVDNRKLDSTFRKGGWFFSNGQ